MADVRVLGKDSENEGADVSQIPDRQVEDGR